jgi:hypothetical protein
MMFPELLAMEHYRLHVIERWPAGLRKNTALEAVRSAIESLRGGEPDDSTWKCVVCGRAASLLSQPVERPA